MDRYFIDERTGYIAVRDRNHTDQDYNGLHSNTAGVVKYWDGEPVGYVCSTCGHSTNRGYMIPNSVILAANTLCEELNSE